MRSSHVGTPFVVLACLWCCSVSCPAQVPAGWFVVSAFGDTAATQPGGLFLFHPRTGALNTVLGLQSDLTGVGSFGFDQGANAVTVRLFDGALIVGEVAPTSQVSLDVHVITLSGNNVVSDVLYSVGNIVGQSTPGGYYAHGSIDQIAQLPSGDLLLAVRGISNPSIGSSPLAILNLQTGNATAIPVNPVPGFVNALAVDASGTFAYAGMYASPAAGMSTIYRASIPAGGFMTPVATFSGNVSQIAIDGAGRLIVSRHVIPGIVIVDPIAGSVTAAPWNAPSNALAVEDATGSFVTANGGGGARSLMLLEPSGASQVLYTWPAAGAPAPSGIGVTPSLRITGSGTSGTNSYAWTLGSNPGGLPLVGNTGFSLTIAGSPAAAPGLWAMATQPLSPPLCVSGALIHIDLATLILMGPLSGSTEEAIPLPIPPIAALAGLELYLQTAHADPAGLAASPGLSVTIL